MDNESKQTQLAHYGATAISPQDTSVWGRFKEFMGLLGNDAVESGFETQSDFAPLSEAYDDAFPTEYSNPMTSNPFTRVLGYLNPIPKTRGDEFARGTEAAMGVLGGMGAAAENKLARIQNLDNISNQLKGVEIDTSQLDRIRNLDEISDMVRDVPIDTSHLEPPMGRIPEGQIGRYGADISKRTTKGTKFSPLEQNVEVPLKQLGGEGLDALIQALSQVVD